MSKAIRYFATRNDLLAMLSELEKCCAVLYGTHRSIKSTEVCLYHEASQIEGLGVVSNDRPMLCPTHLIAPRDTTISVRSVVQRNQSDTHHFIDQLNNPDTVAWHTGGQLDSSTLVAGSFSTCTSTRRSLGLLKRIHDLAHRNWNEVKEYYVGPEAEQILDAGGRLSVGLRPEFDLRR